MRGFGPRLPETAIPQLSPEIAMFICVISGSGDWEMRTDKAIPIDPIFNLLTCGRVILEIRNSDSPEFDDQTGYYCHNHPG